MVTIKFIESEENDRYTIQPSSTKLGRRYDDNSEFVKVIFPENEVDTKCTMIVKDVLNNGIDLIEFTNGEIKYVTTTLSQFDKVLIGFVFTKDNYAKYSSYKTFYFEPSLYPNNFEPREPEFKGSYLQIIKKSFTKARNKENDSSLVEFLNIEGNVVDTLKIAGAGIDINVNNLLNYYLKEETYSKLEVQQLIDAIRSLQKEIVSELPTENIDDNTIYLLPKTSGNGNDYYDEYLYINGAFEFIGSTQLDLTNYIKNTDYATGSKAGIVRISSSYGLGVSSSNGLVSINRATEDEINGKNNNFKPIVPSNLDYAVNSVLKQRITAELLEDGSYSLTINTGD